MKELLKRLPKKYHERVKDFRKEEGLIDNCKYLIEFANGYTLNDSAIFAVKNIKEAINVIKFDICKD